MGTRADRIRGVRRWSQWLIECLRAHGVVREPALGPEAHGALWHVSIRGGPAARIHVTESALTAADEQFDELVAVVDERDWIQMLRLAEHGIRIHADGRVETLERPAGE